MVEVRKSGGDTLEFHKVMQYQCLMASKNMIFNLHSSNTGISIFAPEVAVVLFEFTSA